MLKKENLKLAKVFYYINENNVKMDVYVGSNKQNRQLNNKKIFNNLKEAELELKNIEKEQSNL